MYNAEWLGRVCACMSELLRGWVAVLYKKGACKGLKKVLVSSQRCDGCRYTFGVAHIPAPALGHHQRTM